MPSSRTLRVAAIQVGAIDRKTSPSVVIARLTSLLDKAASEGVKLAVFPETTFTTFFPRYFIENEEELASYFIREPKSGISDVEDASIRAFFSTAKELGIDVVIGYGEETPDKERYNTASYVSAKTGTTVGEHALRRSHHVPIADHPPSTQANIAKFTFLVPWSPSPKLRVSRISWRSGELPNLTSTSGPAH